MKSPVRRQLTIIIAAVVFVSSASAIDINSSQALQYYGNNDLDFQVRESGDAQIYNGGLNITGIANFTETGVSLYQPLSVKSSGPLSVQNGIELTGTSSNTIESYSTFYLSTSSGSPSDIVLDPTGVVGTTSNLDLGGNNITGIGGLQNCGANEFVNGNGNCEVDTDTDTDNQDLSNVLSQGNSAGSYNIDMNGQNILNPNQVDGVDLDNPGNAVTINGDQYAVAGNSINDNEVADNSLTAASISSGAITASGSELASGVAGNQLTLSSGALQVEEGPGSGLNADLLDGMEAVEFENETHGAEHAGSGLSNPSGDTLDVNAGNAITINSDNVAVASGSIDDNEIADNTVDNSEIQNGASFTFGGVTSNGQINAVGSGENLVRLRNGDGGVEISRDGGNAYLDFKNNTSENYDIRIQRTGSNQLKIRGANLNLDNNNINSIGGLQNCGVNEFVNGNGNCEIDTDTDTTKTEDEVEQDIFDTGDNDQGNLGLNGNEIVDTTGSVTLGGGNVDIPDGNLVMAGNNITNPNQVDGVDLDNPGNAVVINGDQIAVAAGSIDDNEIADNTVDNSEIQNGDNFVFNNVNLNGRIEEIGNKGTNNIYDDGDLVVESDDSIEFSDSGTTYMEIGAGASEGNTQISDTGDITTQGRLDVNTEGGEISDNSGTSMNVKSNGNVVVTLG